MVRIGRPAWRGAWDGSDGLMRWQASDLRRSLRVIRRYGVVVGLAVAAGLLAGTATAAFSPLRVTSTAVVLLPRSIPGTANPAVIATSDPVLAGALPRIGPAISLEALRSDVRVTSPTPDVLVVSASAGTAAQAEAAADAVAVSYIGYISSASSPVGRVRALMLASAASVTRTVLPLRLLVGAVLGAVSGLLAGVIAAFADGRMGAGMPSGFRGSDS
jgi:hypothetical protein